MPYVCYSVGVKLMGDAGKWGLNHERLRLGWGFNDVGDAKARELCEVLRVIRRLLLRAQGCDLAVDRLEFGCRHVRFLVSELPSLVVSGVICHRHKLYLSGMGRPHHELVQEPLEVSAVEASLHMCERVFVVEVGYGVVVVVEPAGHDLD